MYKGSGSLGFNSVVCSEGKFMWVPQVDPSPNVTLTMTYVNDKTSESFGQCQVGAPLLGKDTLAALRKFIELAEEDFGKVAFKEGRTGRGAESEETLKPLGG